MALKNPVSRALANLVAFFFRRELRVTRAGARLRVGWASDATPAAATAASPVPAVPALSREQQQLQAMRDELRELLDELPGTREECRNLAFFESALERGGLQALDDVPLDVLASALQQFEGLVTNWGPEGLARLRSKMAVAAAARRKALAASLAQSQAADKAPAAERARQG